MFVNGFVVNNRKKIRTYLPVCIINMKTKNQLH